MEISEKMMEMFEKYCEKNKISGKEKEEKFQKFIELIQKSEYDPLEAIGIIAAHSISEPATQMCIAHDERVIVKVNNKIKIVEIGKFVDNLMEMKGFYNINNSEVLPLNDFEIYAPSLNQTEKIEWKRMVECSRHTTGNKIMKLTTASGREIRSTDSHSYVTRRNNSVMPITGKELNIGDRIPVLNNFVADSVLKEIKVSDFLENVNIDPEQDVVFSTKSSKPVKNSITLDWQTGWFFGAYLAEGSCTISQLGISNMNDEYIENAKVFVDRLGLGYKEYFHHREFSSGRDMVVSSAILSRFVTASCNTGSSHKHVPDFAYNASDEFVSGLLRGYFDGDGNFHVDRKMIRVSSNSEELVNGIALLLSRFKIFSFKTKDNKGQNWLLIPYKYAPLFLLRIGSDINHKKQALESLAEKAKRFWDVKSQDFTDMISGFDDILYNVAKRLGHPTRYINNFTKRQRIGRTALFRYIRLFEDIAKKKNIDISKEITIMRQMAYSDVIWDEIVNIEYVDYDQKHVYDFSVPGLETFTTFDGIITHNTMRTYTLATQKDRLSKVTQGLPRLMEIFDAKKSLQKQMRIWLTKEYNTKEKAKEIADFIKSKKVKDVITTDSIDLVDMKIELDVDENEKDNIMNLVKKANIEVSARGRKIIIKPKKSDVKVLRKLRSKLLDAHVDGIKNIEEVVVVKEGDDWVIQTAGTNLKKILRVPGVDIARTTTNDLFQMHEVLGIEAARAVIARETQETLDEQGLEVDLRHISLLADIMTVDGEVKAIGRYGISGAKASVLARANFEETKKHLVNASFGGEKDKLAGVIENVLIVQVIPVGTGGVSLKVDVEKMIQAKRTSKPKSEE
ncbi:MAG: DNA-directed RNA polymerase subunit A'' [Candidatus Aenigmarchaeota archaeon]|nr:DNA-directed RNA polymerase subunit A'' [Candidatus Aenigmarchaeota archaeon]